MNVNQIKYNLRKRKTSVRKKQILDERHLTAFKEKAPVYVDVTGLANNQQNKKG